MILLLLLFCMFGKSISDNAGGCEIKSISPKDWRIGKRWHPKLQTEKFSHHIQFEGDLEIIEQRCHFLNLNITRNQIVVTNAPEIEEIDNMIPPSPKFEATCELSLRCKDGKSVLTLVQPIIDVNNYEPVFHNSSYQILTPKTVPPDTDLMQYMKNPIQVEDLDFSNYNISFELRPDIFMVKTKILDLMYKRIYIPVIVTKKELEVTQAIHLLLSATDTGNIPYALSSATKITLQQRQSSEDSYSIYFSNDSYQFIYEENGNNQLDLEEGVDIKLFSDDTDVQVYISSEDAEVGDYFDTSYDTSTQRIKISVLRPLPPMLTYNRKLIFAVCAKSLRFLNKACTDIHITIK